MQINYILLGQRIRAFRTKKGITQMELAERIDRSAAYMSYVETAYKSCSLDTLVMVANELNVSTDDLLIDSLTNTIKASNHEFTAILSDCSDYEMRVLLDIVKATKQAMREYKYLTRANRRQNYKLLSASMEHSESQRINLQFAKQQLHKQTVKRANPRNVRLRI